MPEALLRVASLLSLLISRLNSPFFGENATDDSKFHHQVVEYLAVSQSIRRRAEEAVYSDDAMKRERSSNITIKVNPAKCQRS